ncbi:MAG: glycosyltransferase [Gammaproteobacteria bacterium]|nr:glycosyltransferase [Gammaproteobacteria bacterium]
MLQTLHDFDLQYQPNMLWPVGLFHAYETVQFEPLAVADKIALLQQFHPISPALQLWQQLQFMLLGAGNADINTFTRLFRELPFLQQNMVYSQLMRSSFVGKAIGLDLAPFYRLTIESFCRENAERCTVQPLQGNGNEEFAVFITNQFVSSMHGPTLTVLNYASALKQIGMHPIVICTTSVAKSTHLVYPMPTPIFFGTVRNEYFSSNTLFDLDQGQQQPNPAGSAVQCWGQQFDFMQTTPMDDPAHLVDLVNFINQLNPRFIIGVGGLNPVLEFIAKARPVLSVPCVTSLVLPIYAVPVLHRELTPADQQRIDSLGIQHQVLSSRLPFRLRQFDAVKSSRVDDKVLKFVVVGYRLEDEIRGEFMQTMLAIKQHYPLATFILVGPSAIADYPPVLQQCSYLTGRISNAIDLIATCHFMLNPKRQGGGTSAVEALSLGIPVLTQAYGDVYQYIGDPFVFETDEQRLAFIQQYLTDPEFAAAYQDICLETAAQATDTAAIVQELLLTYDAYLQQLQYENGSELMA